MTAIHAGAEVTPLSVLIQQPQIKAYADASGDQNPIHQDQEIALAMGLPGVIAHGMLNFGLLSRALTDWLGDPGRLRSLKVRFSAMVQPGDTVNCRGTVAVIDAAAGTATLKVWVENQRGEKVLGHGEALITLRPGAARPGAPPLRRIDIGLC